ncbi:MAG TPA: hypothetical protein VFU22_16555 [Roseiflexaceae bacterium]|nr:hypothetical protein [Roseiflexaceae bacterium]
MYFLEYTTAKGKHYALRAEQIRALEGSDQETRIYASIAGVPLTFSVKRPYREVRAELERLAAESEVSA